MLRRILAGLADDERGSSPVEFVLVGTLLTVLTLAVRLNLFARFIFLISFG